jgi:hypothetical protein
MKLSFRVVALGRDDDPSLPLQVEEEIPEPGNAVSSSVPEGFTDVEARVVELMLRGERKTQVYAEAYGIADLSPDEQRRIVKQVKDKLKKRLLRARRDDEQAP